MLIGNRPRPQQMQRTTSMTRITVVEVDDDDDQISAQEADVVMLSPENQQRRNKRKDNGTKSSPSSFLGKCGFCKRRLTPSRDIYMYKGNAAFCSEECREKQIEHDEGKTRNGAVLRSPTN